MVCSFNLPYAIWLIGVMVTFSLYISCRKAYRQQFRYAKACVQNRRNKMTQIFEVMFLLHTDNVFLDLININKAHAWLTQWLSVAAHRNKAPAVSCCFTTPCVEFCQQVPFKVCPCSTSSVSCRGQHRKYKIKYNPKYTKLNIDKQLGTSFVCVWHSDRHALSLCSDMLRASRAMGAVLHIALGIMNNGEREKPKAWQLSSCLIHI